MTSPRTHGVGNKRFTDYEVRMRTNLPAFKIKEFRCRRRYSDFVWLRTEIKRAVQVIRVLNLLRNGTNIGALIPSPES